MSQRHSGDWISISTWMRSSCGKTMRIIFKGIAVLMLGGLLAGCATSRSVQMVTKRNSPDAPTSTDGIVLAKHPQPQPDEQRLNHVLTEVLGANVQNSKPGNQADYVLAYWIDESWDEVIPVDQSAKQENYQQSIHQVAGMSGDRTGGRIQGESFHSLKEGSKPNQHYISKKGVKLFLYSNRAPASARLTPVWEGYIEVGSTESSQQLKGAVKNLLAQFGKDFAGRVALQK